MNSNLRDFTSVSPSAKILLLKKGYTGIPYARRAAELMVYPEKFEPDFEGKDFVFCIRVAHFEARYRSIDTLLADIPAPNILELSSGFSFRGLDYVRHTAGHYIDTDLEAVIERKKELVSALEGDGLAAIGLLELLPLNALDERRFSEVISHFPVGPVVIVNEGLLVYLNLDEKKQLCRSIHQILSERGGFWITADIYLKTTPEMNRMQTNDALQAFFDQHHIEDNKFGSFESAENLFRECGLVIDRECVPEYAGLEAVKYAMQQLSPEQMSKMGSSRKIHTTWRLRVA